MAQHSESTLERFAELPEPARSRAAQFYQELRDNGRDHDLALVQAKQLAEKWMAERAPGDSSTT